MRGDLLALKVRLPLRDRLRGDRDAALLATRCVRCTNPYRVWIAEYAGDHTRRSTKARRSWIVSPISTPRRPQAELIVIFKEAARLEATSGRWAGVRTSASNSH